MLPEEMHVCLGVTGAVSAQAAPAFCHFLRRAVGINRLDVAITESALQFVTPNALFQATGRPVLVDWKDYDCFGPGGHINFAKNINLLLVSPASASFIGSLASGLASSPLLMVALATNAPVFLIPSINASVWRHPIVQHQTSVLRSSGIRVIENPTGISLGEDEVQPGLDISMPALVREIMNEAQALLTAAEGE